tara:strand:+ start:1775 stop:2515 length:741 start_codon:yes stop_codon:yes gene_type:complete
MLKKKTAVLTGSSRGIGKEILSIFAENNANIIACSREEDVKHIKFIEDLKKKNNVEIDPYFFDLADTNLLKEKALEIIKKHKKIDILINNAGVIHTALFQMTTINKFKEIFETNFFSTVQFTQIILKSMMPHKNGSIINISSTSAFDNEDGRSAYSSSKLSLVSLTKTLSNELGRFNIRVNSIAPGLTQTDMAMQNTKKEMIDKIINDTALKRIGNTKDIANTALFLSSELSSYITGQTIRVDGGM